MANVSRHLTPQVNLNQWVWAAACILLGAASTVKADLFSGDYVYTLQRDRIVRNLGSTPVSLLAPNNSSPESSQAEAKRQAANIVGKNRQPQEPPIGARMREQSRQIQDQTGQMVADSFNESTDEAYSPEFVDRTLLHSNDAKIRATQTTAARVQSRLSQLQGSTSPTAASERSALQEQINLLKIKEDQLRAEQQELRN